MTMTPTAAASADALGQFAPTGKLRASINHGNPVLAQILETGELRGVSVVLARELANRLGVPLELVPFDAAGKAFNALSTGQCDVGFLAIDPVRGEEIDYTGPYVLIEGAYLVNANGPFVDTADIDQPGVRIAAGRNTAYDLYLRRELKHASLVYATRSTDAIDLFLSGGADVVAGIRQPLADVARERPDLRLTRGRFMAIEQAMAMPKGREAAMSYLRSFLEDVKASGLVRRTLDDTGQHEANVAIAR